MSDPRPIKRLLKWLEKQRLDWLSIADGDSMDHATCEAELIGEFQKLVQNIAAQAAEIERLTRERDEALRRRDEWRKKAEGYDELAAAVRAGIEDAGTRNLSRVFLRGALVDSEKRLAAAEAEAERLREALSSIDGMVQEATRAPLTADRWLDRIEECARAALGQQP